MARATSRSSAWCYARHRPPPPGAPGVVADWPAAPQLGTWPSVALFPGASFGLSNMTAYVDGGCDALGACFKQASGSGLWRGRQSVVPAGASLDVLLRPGFVECGMPIVANRTDPGKGEGVRGRERGERARCCRAPRTSNSLLLLPCPLVIGSALIWYRDSVVVCAEDPSTPRTPRALASLPFARRPIAGADAAREAARAPRRSPWWIVLIIVGVASVVASVVGALSARRRRARAARKRASLEEGRGAGASGGSPPSGTRTSTASPNGGGLGGGGAGASQTTSLPALDAALFESVTGGSQVRGWEGLWGGARLERQRLSTQTDALPPPLPL